MKIIENDKNFSKQPQFKNSLARKKNDDTNSKFTILLLRTTLILSKILNRLNYVQEISEDSLDLISSPLPSVKN